MEQRRLGANGPEVGAIGYGAMSFSDMYGPTNETESHAILNACRDLGVTHLDTANVYGMGKSESALGSYLKANPGARDEFVIATKATITTDADGNRQEREEAFDMLHVTPPQRAPRCVRESALANDAGWLDADPDTLRHNRFENVFAIGDASGTAVNDSAESTGFFEVGDTFSIDVTSGSIDVSDAAAARGTIGSIDSAISKVSEQMSTIGDSQSRLTFKADNLETSKTNYEAARSRIEDADFAQEQMNIVKLQILQQTGSASFAQANAALDEIACIMNERTSGRVFALDWGPWSGAPRLARIDHAFALGVAFEGFQVVPVRGADHSAIVMDLASG